MRTEEEEEEEEEEDMVGSDGWLMAALWKAGACSTIAYLFIADIRI
jgi:hypothetical protein